MVCGLKLWVFQIVVLAQKILINCEPNWTFDMVSVSADNKTPDVVFVELYLTRPARGVYAVSGIFDIKEDLTDEWLISVPVYYSKIGSNFIKTPYRIPESKLTSFMNTFYKQLAMESFLNCTDNGPRVEGEFEPPLTKRTIHFNDCIFSNENMPSNVQSGYYKAILEIRGQAVSDVELLIMVESK